MEPALCQILNQAATIWGHIKKRKPLIHHITNGVAMTEQAHLTLAIGASPVMALDLGESAEMAKNADALLLNTGTPSESQLQSMLAAQKSAHKKGIPIILDPVGFGATKLRNRTVLKILDHGSVSIIKGNHGEISALGGNMGTVKGVDSNLADASHLKETASLLSRKYNAVVVSTGKEDMIAQGNRIISVSGGHAFLAKISGSGCWLGSITACAAAVSPHVFSACLSAVIALNRASEKVGAKGMGRFRMEIFDQLCALKGKDLLDIGDRLQWI